MATVDEGLQTQIRNIEATYGKPMHEWFAVIAASGMTKHTEVVAMLKTSYGMTHGAAHRVSLLARNHTGQPEHPGRDGDPADVLYAGIRAALRPVHEELMRAVLALGDDIESIPKKGYLSLRRGKQFGMIQPSTAARVDIGLVLKGVPARGRLETAAGFNALFTHRVRLTAAAEVDAELVGWLACAYDQAG